MLIEGPIATYVAAFAASAGLLNIYIIFILAVFGNLIPDCFFFFVGRHSRVKAVESFLESFWINKSRIKKIEKGLHKHIKKSIVVLKLTPGLGIPGILLAGFTKVPFRKFFSKKIKCLIFYQLNCLMLFQLCF